MAESVIKVMNSDNSLLWGDVPGISNISAFENIPDGLWNIGTSDVTRMTDKPTGMSDNKVYMICHKASSSAFMILIAPKDNLIYFRTKYTLWNVWVRCVFE